jgi:hypothetical protein
MEEPSRSITPIVAPELEALVELGVGLATRRSSKTIVPKVTGSR